ncbi:MAG: site-2 protease family protein [Candidatus Melainabacteria bacterium]|nr:site-2 protease family protein [Candidatus Melainabacteria bacterium]
MELTIFSALAGSALPGILAMIAGITFLIFIHELGHWLIARMLGFKTPVFSIGFGKREHSLILGRLWETEFRLSPIPLGGYVSIPELEDESTALKTTAQSGRSRSAYKRFPVWKRISVAVAGVAMNALFAVVAIATLYTFVGKPSTQTESVSIDKMSREVTIARDAGLATGDRFVSVDGQTVKTPQDLIAALRDHPNQRFEIVVSRQGHNVSVTVTTDSNGQLGIDSVSVQTTRKFTPMKAGQALSEGLTTAVDTIGEMFRAVGIIAGQLEPPPNLPSGATDLHGIVAIVSIGQQAFDRDTFSFVWLLAIFSLNLAVLNILPLPPLDGGYVLFYSIEGIFRRSVPAGVRTRLTNVFFLLFVLLTLWGLFNDIFKPIKLG